MSKKKVAVPNATPPSSVLTVHDIDAFDAAHHRAPRRIRLAIHALDNPGDELATDHDEFASAIAELLTDAADDLVTADETIQRAWKGMPDEC